jgi:hypothetical protein
MPSVVLGERYELRNRIGSGGAAMIPRGFDTLLGREVTTKSRALASEERFRHRLEREGCYIA